MAANYYGVPPKKQYQTYQFAPPAQANAKTGTVAPTGEAPASKQGGNGNDGGVYPDGDPDPDIGKDNPEIPEIPVVPNNAPNVPDPWGTGGLGANFDPGGTHSGSGDAYKSATGGLVGYYGQQMGSNGLSEAEYNALNRSTYLPIQQEGQAAKDEMLRVRAATGNDAGIYGGVAQVSKNTGQALADQSRKNVLANADVKRQERASGAAGTLNLYGQEQAQSMEYLRMLGNLLGRQRGATSNSDTNGYNAGVQVGYSI